MSLSFNGGNTDGDPLITKSFVVDGYTYTNQCGLAPNVVGPTDSVTVTGPAFDLRWVSETRQNGASTLDAPAYSEQDNRTSVQLADATGPGDGDFLVVVSPAELTNRATGATQTINLIVQSSKQTSVIGCSLSGTVTPGGQAQGGAS
ncbi:MAG TPA: hypothetical protein VFI54_07075 [Solirubrobacteraceae bacterium]|nr:hypothetical protein [Solirubrobacteraceae bacterium]